MKSPVKTAVLLALSLTIAGTLTACGPANPDIRPTDAKLRDGISLLLKDLALNHPASKTWNEQAVEAQIQKKLPVGLSTPAGWKLTWPSAGINEISTVYVPWDLTGTYPNHFAADNATYTSGTEVPQSVVQDITEQQLGSDQYFAAIVDVRYSKANKHWIIFTSVPYLPVTDNAYGWATVVKGKWKVVDFGTALVGCGKVPNEVQLEFGFMCKN